MTDRLRATVFCAVSLDGCIARADGSLDWLPGADPADAEEFAEAAGGGEDDPTGYAALLAEVDGIVMGRATYDVVLGFGIGWPYEVPVVVLTNRALDPLAGADVRTLTGDVEEVAATLLADGWTHAYVDGGAVVQQFLAADLVERMTLTRVPVVLGDGIRLFGAPADERWFEPDTPVVLDDGLVQTTYRRVR